MVTAAERSDGSQAGRLRLVEYRQDEATKAIDALTLKVGQIYSLMIGILCSVVVACILLVINVATGQR